MGIGFCTIAIPTINLGGRSHQANYVHMERAIALSERHLGRRDVLCKLTFARAPCHHPPFAVYTGDQDNCLLPLPRPAQSLTFRHNKDVVVRSAASIVHRR